jgi:hypothetical protein
MKPSSIHLLAPVLLALAAGISHGAVISDDFENGLTGWTTRGDVSVQGAPGSRAIVLTTALTGTSDDPMALNLSGVDPASSAGSLDTFVGIGLAALDLDPINQATEGSAFKRTFSVLAGDTLTFDWQLATRETVGQDYAFVTIGGTLITLGDVSDAINASIAPYGTETGVATFQYTFATSGNVTIAFGITDVGDYSTTSKLTIDNLSVVPEPSAALLGALGAVVLLRRRRK